MLFQMNYAQNRNLITKIVKTINEKYMTRIPLLMTLSIIMLVGIILTIVLR